MTVKETFFWIFIEDLQELDSLTDYPRTGINDKCLGL